jgi:hypothetical protein
MTPEEKARQQIDAMLVASGWVIQDYEALNLSAGLGVAVREVPLTTGPCDYLLLVNRIPVGVVEAKKKGTTLSPIADQFRANSGLKSQEYSAPVLGLIFLRFAEVRFAAQRAKMDKAAAKGGNGHSPRRGPRLDEPAAHHAEGILYLPAEACDLLVPRLLSGQVELKAEAA